MIPIKHKMTEQPKTNRQPEKWFRILLWIIALIFAGFLIGLGGKIVGDLPLIQSEPKEIADYVDDKNTYQQLKQELTRQQNIQKDIQNQYDTVSLQLEQQKTITQNAQHSFNNWLATRSVTEQSTQNPEVIKRTNELDNLKAKEAEIQKNLAVIEQKQLSSEQSYNDTQDKIQNLEDIAQHAKTQDDQKIELRVFIYRLLITLPLLLLAWYLFTRHRNGNLWPFVWGFGFFALFVFFVELVPYLPSYGGYVRYGVGIILTFVGGRYAIIAMNHYLQRKKVEEEISRNQRQSQLNYEQAQNKLAKSICPSCERKLDLTDNNLDFCPHCGICIFNYCDNCHTRNNAFNHYCYKCGNDHSQSLANHNKPKVTDASSNNP